VSIHVTGGRFSKRLENLKAAVAPYVAWYYFYCLHMGLRATRAMKPGITNKVWTIDELLT